MRHMIRGASIAVALAIAACLLSTRAQAEDEPKVEKKTKEAPLARRQRLAKAVRNSFCRVEVTLRFDERGRPPQGLGMGSESSYTNLMVQKRPWELTGFVLSPTLIAMSDFEVPARYIEAIHIVPAEGGDPIPATLTKIGVRTPFMLLEAAGPIPSAKPIEFTDDADAQPEYAAWFGTSEGEWVITLASTMGRVNVGEDGQPWSASWSTSILLTREGDAVGLSFDGEIPLAGEWRGSPLAFEQISIEDTQALQAQTLAAANAGLLHVRMRFRSPKKADESNSPWNYRSNQDEGDTETERHAVGVLLDASRVLVLEKLKPAVTARLETIEAWTAGGEPVAASFAGSLKDYGGIIAELSTPIGQPVRAPEATLRSQLRELMGAAHVALQGDTRVTDIDLNRVHTIEQSWGRQLVASFRGDEENSFVFDRSGRLLVLPISRRVAEAESRWRSASVVMLPITYLTGALEMDANNIPLSEDEEGRLAWLGVETQPMDAELARANEVTHLTDGGSIGGIVSYVYPDSPAARGGIEAGAILLRVHSPERAKPVPINGGGEESQMRAIFEQMRGSIPPEMLDQFPGFQPWGSARTSINTTLTELGFGKPFELEYVVDGEVKRAKFTVERGPRHYEMATKWKCERLGFTVRELTYEVRRYFRLEPDTKGVIVSKVESGETAAVAGMRPFEIISEIGTSPLLTVKELQDAVAKGGELQLKLKDRLKERVVKLKLGDE